MAVFGLEFDSALKLGLRAGRSIEEVFEEGIIGQKMTDIREMIKSGIEDEDNMVLASTTLCEQEQHGHAGEIVVANHPNELDTNTSHHQHTNGPRIRTSVQSRHVNQITSLPEQPNGNDN